MIGDINIEEFKRAGQKLILEPRNRNGSKIQMQLEPFIANLIPKSGKIIMDTEYSVPPQHMRHYRDALSEIPLEDVVHTPDGIEYIIKLIGERFIEDNRLDHGISEIIIEILDESSRETHLPMIFTAERLTVYIDRLVIEVIDEHSLRIAAQISYTCKNSKRISY